MAVLNSRTIEIINNISPGADQVGLGDLMEQALSGVLPPGSVSVGEIGLTTGSIILGASSVGSALDVKGDTKIMIGNGTTAAMYALSGDVTMTNTGDVTLGTLDHDLTIDAAHLIFTGAVDKVIAAGSYGSQLVHPGGELVTIAARGAADGWYLGIGSYMTAASEDGKAFPLCTLAEIVAPAGTDRIQGAQCMAFLGSPGGAEAVHLKTLGGDGTAGMYAGWFKIGANSNCVVDSGARAAALWVDNQLSGTITGEEYGIFATTGASKPDAFVGFETTSSGYASLFYFDETAYDQDPCVSGNCTGGNKDYHLKVNMNGTMYGIQLYAL